MYRRFVRAYGRRVSLGDHRPPIEPRGNKRPIGQPASRHHAKSGETYFVARKAHRMVWARCARSSPSARVPHKYSNGGLTAFRPLTLKSMRITFIGLGHMGSGIASNLLEAGHQLTVYNRSESKAKPLADRGATIAPSPAEACRHCDAVLTMLADDHAVESVVFGKDGIASALPAGSAHISHSTISTSFARRLTEEHASRGQGYLSVPVFGRPEAAASKMLIVVPAGPSDLIDRFRPLFSAIGRATFVVGSDPWQANAVKLCGNFMIAAVLESFGETFAVIRKSGVDHHVFFHIMSELFGSPVYKGYGGAIANEHFSPAGFALKLGLKDVRLALQASEEVEAPMPFASILRDQFISALANGQGDLDWSSVGMIAARNAGLK